MQRICQSNVDDIFSVAHDCDEATVWTVQKGGCKYFRRTDLFDRERNLVSFCSSIVTKGLDAP